MIASQSTLAASCVLYARATSGIALQGDAYTWWDAAAGRYLRGQVPEAGAILVLARTERLQRGHLAVVRQVLDERDILVDHSNWVPGRIITGMQVRDVSPANDWTALRFLNPGPGVFGSVYPADGFIYRTLPVPALSEGSSQLGPQVAAQQTSALQIDHRIQQ
jgi:surface antigen